MDSMNCRTLSLVLCLGALACQSDPPSPSIPHASQKPVSAVPPLAPSALRVSPDRLSRIEIQSPRQTVTLERSGAQWMITSPITFLAAAPAMDSILGVMAGIEVVAEEEANPAALRSRGLDAAAVTVKAWVGDRVESHFRVGHGTREKTFVQRVGDTRILTVRGRCRPAFDRPLDELRHAVVTDVDPRHVEEVTYVDGDVHLKLAADPPGSGNFRLHGIPVRSFDASRANKNVAVLAHLLAKGFSDPPLPNHTGLFDKATPRATLRVRGDGPLRSVDVWIGAKTEDGRLFVRTSASDQVYLVSAHLESSLVPKRSHLERGEEAVHPPGGKASHHAHEGHVHGPRGAPPTQVPPELLRELRAMAREQRGP
jgi:hypothetical protein